MMTCSRRTKAAALATLLGAASHANAIVTSGSIDTTGTTNWDGVGALVSQSQYFSSASGVLIDSTHFLTAAHAVYDSSQNAPAAPTTFKFQLGADSYSISSITLMPGYSSSNPSYQDLAVVTLTQPASGHTTYGYNTGSITETAAATVLVGYGIGGSPSASAGAYPYGVKRAVANAVDLNTDDTNYKPNNTVGFLPAGLIVYDYDDPTATTGGKTGGTAISYFGLPEGDTANGDSGGPMFQLDSNGNWIVTGITSDGTSKNSKYNDVSWGTRVSDYSTFITATVPEPTALALLLAFPLRRRSRRVK